MTETGSASDLAALFGVTTRTITDLAARDLVVKSGRGVFDVAASTTRYIKHLRDTAAGRGGDDGLTSERTRLARLQADAAAIRNDEARGKLVDVSLFERRWSDEMATLRGRLLAVSGDLALENPQFSKHDIATFDQALRDAMTAIATDAAN